MDSEARQQCKKAWLLTQDFKKIFHCNFKEDHFMKDSERVDRHFSKGHSACCCWMPSVPMATSNTKAQNTLTDQDFKLKAQHRTASEAQWHFCAVSKQMRHVKNVKD